MLSPEKQTSPVFEKSGCAAEQPARADQPEKQAIHE
jgi:hypothetical protein